MNQNDSDRYADLKEPEKGYIGPTYQYTTREDSYNNSHEKMSGEQFAAAMEGKEIPMNVDEEDDDEASTVSEAEIIAEGKPEGEADDKGTSDEEKPESVTKKETE